MSSASNTVTSAQTRRLLKEFQDYQQNPLPFVVNLQLFIDKEGFNQLTGVLLGPDSTPYENGHFRFRVKFPLEYPFKAHEFVFLTQICHPNVQISTGLVCHEEMIFSWTPKITLSSLLTKMYAFLAHPAYSKPFPDEEHIDKNTDKARQWTALYLNVLI